jgi:hypothetical protein
MLDGGGGGGGELDKKLYKMLRCIKFINEMLAKIENLWNIIHGLMIKKIYM